MKLSLNTATVRKQWTLAQIIDGCARYPITGISPWRDQVAQMGLKPAHRAIRAAGLNMLRTGWWTGWSRTRNGWRRS